MPKELTPLAPTADSGTTSPLIGLLVMFKNEEPVLPRFIESVGPHIDYWTAIDTGSKDGSADLITDGFAGIEGRLIKRKWKNFGENLTEALAQAQGRSEWVLWLHADMTLEVHPKLAEWLLDDPDPTVDAWQILVQSGGLRYRVPLLTRGSLEWRYVGVTHEYLDPMGRRQRPLLGLSVNHHCDGSRRPDKLDRDRALLEDALQKNPDDPRTVFYLAQTYRDLGDRERAVLLYRRREEMGGWEEEAWYAGYQVAALEKNVDSLITSYFARPTRHEPLKAAAAIVRERESSDILFVETT